MFGLVRRLRDRLNVPDERHVERVRRSLASFDRWKRRLVVFYALLAAALASLFVGAFFLLERMERFLHEPPGPGTLGFFLGIMMGAMVGIAAVNLGQGLVNLLLGFRNERLMIRYHDALEELRPSNPVDGEGPFNGPRESPAATVPRLRFSVRLLMMIVAAAAVVLFLIAQVIAHQRRQQAETSAWGATRFEQLADRAELDYRLDPVKNAKARNRADALRKQAARFQRISEQYRQAASRPWQRMADPDGTAARRPDGPGRSPFDVRERVR